MKFIDAHKITKVVITCACGREYNAGKPFIEHVKTCFVWQRVPESERTVIEGLLSLKKGAIL